MANGVNLKTYEIEVIAKVDKAKEEIKAIQKMVDQFDKNNQHTSIDFSQMQSDLDGLKTKYSQTIDALNNSTNSLDISKQLADMNQKLDASLSNITQKAADLADVLSKDPAKFEQFVSRMVTPLNDLRTTVSELTAEMKRFNDVKFGVNVDSNVAKDITKVSKSAEEAMKLLSKLPLSFNALSDVENHFSDGFVEFVENGKDVSVSISEIAQAISILENEFKGASKISIEKFLQTNKVKAEWNNLLNYVSQVKRQLNEGDPTRKKGNKSAGSVEQVINLRYRVQGQKSEEEIETIIDTLKQGVIKRLNEKLKDSKDVKIAIPIGYTLDTSVADEAQKKVFGDLNDNYVGDDEKTLFKGIVVKVKENVDGLSESINEIIDNQNKLLEQTGKTINIKMRVIPDEDNVDDVTDQITNSVNSIARNNISINGGSININSENIELTLNNIYDLLTSWDGGLPGMRQNTFRQQKIREQQIQSQSSYFSDYFRRGKISSPTRVVSEITDYTSRILADYMLSEEKKAAIRTVRNNANVKAGNEEGLKFLRSSELYTKAFSYNGEMYATFGVDKTLKEWQDYLEELWRTGELIKRQTRKTKSGSEKVEYVGALKNMADDVNKSQASYRKDLALNGVEFTKINGRRSLRIQGEKAGNIGNDIYYINEDGSITKQGGEHYRTGVIKNQEEYYVKVSQSAEAIRRDAEETFNVIIAEKDELMAQRSIMQQIVNLRAKGPLSEEDSIKLNRLEADLRKRAVAPTDRDEIERLKIRKKELSEKLYSTGLTNAEYSEFVGINDRVQSLYSSIPNVLEYVNTNLQAGSDGVSNIDRRIDELQKEAEGVARRTRSTLSSIFIPYIDQYKDASLDRQREVFGRGQNAAKAARDNPFRFTEDNRIYGKIEREYFTAPNISPKEYLWAEKRIQELQFRNSQLERFITTSDGKQDFSALSRSERVEYGQNRKKIAYLNTRNAMYRAQESFSAKTTGKSSAWELIEEVEEAKARIKSFNQRIALQETYIKKATTQADKDRAQALIDEYKDNVSKETARIDRLTKQIGIDRTHILSSNIDNESARAAYSGVLAKYLGKKGARSNYSFSDYVRDIEDDALQEIVDITRGYVSEYEANPNAWSIQERLDALLGKKANKGIIYDAQHQVDLAKGISGYDVTKIQAPNEGNKVILDGRIANDQRALADLSAEEAKLEEQIIAAKRELQYIIETRDAAKVKNDTISFDKLDKEATEKKKNIAELEKLKKEIPARRKQLESSISDAEDELRKYTEDRTVYEAAQTVIRGRKEVVDLQAQLSEIDSTIQQKIAAANEERIKSLQAQKDAAEKHLKELEGKEKTVSINSAIEKTKKVISELTSSIAFVQRANQVGLTKLQIDRLKADQKRATTEEERDRIQGEIDGLKAKKANMGYEKQYETLSAILATRRDIVEQIKEEYSLTRDEADELLNPRNYTKKTLSQDDVTTRLKENTAERKALLEEGRKYDRDLFKVSTDEEVDVIRTKFKDAISRKKQLDEDLANNVVVESDIEKEYSDLVSFINQYKEVMSKSIAKHKEVNSALSKLAETRKTLTDYAGILSEHGIVGSQTGSFKDDKIYSFDSGRAIDLTKFFHMTNSEDKTGYGIQSLFANYESQKAFRNSAGFMNAGLYEAIFRYNSAEAQRNSNVSDIAGRYFANANAKQEEIIADLEESIARHTDNITRLTSQRDRQNERYRSLDEKGTRLNADIAVKKYDINKTQTAISSSTSEDVTMRLTEQITRQNEELDALNKSLLDLETERKAILDDIGSLSRDISSEESAINIDNYKLSISRMSLADQVREILQADERLGSKRSKVSKIAELRLAKEDLDSSLGKSGDLIKLRKRRDQLNSRLINANVDPEFRKNVLEYYDNIMKEFSDIISPARAQEIRDSIRKIAGEVQEETSRLRDVTDNFLQRTGKYGYGILNNLALQQFADTGFASVENEGRTRSTLIERLQGYGVNFTGFGSTTSQLTGEMASSIIKSFIEDNNIEQDTLGILANMKQAAMFWHEYKEATDLAREEIESNVVFSGYIFNGPNKSSDERSRYDEMDDPDQLLQRIYNPTKSHITLGDVLDTPLFTDVMLTSNGDPEELQKHLKDLIAVRKGFSREFNEYFKKLVENLTQHFTTDMMDENPDADVNAIKEEAAARAKEKADEYLHFILNYTNKLLDNFGINESMDIGLSDLTKGETLGSFMDIQTDVDEAYHEVMVQLSKILGESIETTISKAATAAKSENFDLRKYIIERLDVADTSGMGNGNKNLYRLLSSSDKVTVDEARKLLDLSLEQLEVRRKNREEIERLTEEELERTKSRIGVISSSIDEHQSAIGSYDQEVESLKKENELIERQIALLRDRSNISSPFNKAVNEAETDLLSSSVYRMISGAQANTQSRHPHYIDYIKGVREEGLPIRDAMDYRHQTVEQNKDALFSLFSKDKDYISFARRVDDIRKSFKDRSMTYTQYLERQHATEADFNEIKEREVNVLEGVVRAAKVGGDIVTFSDHYEKATLEFYSIFHSILERKNEISELKSLDIEKEADDRIESIKKNNSSVSKEYLASYRENYIKNRRIGVEQSIYKLEEEIRDLNKKYLASSEEFDIFIKTIQATSPDELLSSEQIHSAAEELGKKIDAVKNRTYQDFLKQANILTEEEFNEDQTRIPGNLESELRKYRAENREALQSQIDYIRVIRNNAGGVYTNDDLLDALTRRDLVTNKKTGLEASLSKETDADVITSTLAEISKLDAAISNIDEEIIVMRNYLALDGIDISMLEQLNDYYNQYDAILERISSRIPKAKKLQYTTAEVNTFKDALNAFKEIDPNSANRDDLQSSSVDSIVSIFGKNNDVLIDKVMYFYNSELTNIASILQKKILSSIIPSTGSIYQEIVDKVNKNNYTEAEKSVVKDLSTNSEKIKALIDLKVKDMISGQYGDYLKLLRAINPNLGESHIPIDDFTRSILDASGIVDRDKISDSSYSILSDVGRTEDDITSRIIRRNKASQEQVAILEAIKQKEILGNNDQEKIADIERQIAEVFRERLVLLDSQGKVVASHIGTGDNVTGFSEDELKSASGGKILHSHSSGSGMFSPSDFMNMFKQNISQISLLFDDSSFSIDRSKFIGEDATALTSIMKSLQDSLSEVYGDNGVARPSTREAIGHIKTIYRAIFKNIADQFNLTFSEDGTYIDMANNALSDIDKAVISHVSSLIKNKALPTGVDLSQEIRNIIGDASYDFDAANRLYYSKADIAYKDIYDISEVYSNILALEAPAMKQQATLEAQKLDKVLLHVTGEYIDQLEAEFNNAVAARDAELQRLSALKESNDSRIGRITGEYKAPGVKVDQTESLLSKEKMLLAQDEEMLRIERDMNEEQRIRAAAIDYLLIEYEELNKKTKELLSENESEIVQKRMSEIRLELAQFSNMAVESGLKISSETGRAYLHEEDATVELAGAANLVKRNANTPIKQMRKLIDDLTKKIEELENTGGDEATIKTLKIQLEQLEAQYRSVNASEYYRKSIEEARAFQTARLNSFLNAKNPLVDEYNAQNREKKRLYKAYQYAGMTQEQADLAHQIAVINSKLKEENDLSVTEEDTLRRQLELLQEKARLSGMIFDNNGYVKNPLRFEEFEKNPEAYLTNNYAREYLANGRVNYQIESYRAATESTLQSVLKVLLNGVKVYTDSNYKYESSIARLGYDSNLPSPDENPNSMYNMYRSFKNKRNQSDREKAYNYNKMNSEQKAIVDEYLGLVKNLYKDGKKDPRVLKQLKALREKAKSYGLSVGKKSGNLYLSDKNADINKEDKQYASTKEREELKEKRRSWNRIFSNKKSSKEAMQKAFDEMLSYGQGIGSGKGKNGKAYTFIGHSGNKAVSSAATEEFAKQHGLTFDKSKYGVKAPVIKADEVRVEAKAQPKQEATDKKKANIPFLINGITDQAKKSEFMKRAVASGFYGINNKGNLVGAKNADKAATDKFFKANNIQATGESKGTTDQKREWFDKFRKDLFSYTDTVTPEAKQATDASTQAKKEEASATKNVTQSISDLAVVIRGIKDADKANALKARALQTGNYGLDAYGDLTQKANNFDERTTIQFLASHGLRGKVNPLFKDTNPSEKTKQERAAYLTALEQDINKELDSGNAAFQFRLKLDPENVQQEGASIANSVLASVRAVLGINSPSTKMIELGYWTVEGFVVGLMQSAPEIREAIAKIFGQFSQAEWDTFYKDTVDAGHDYSSNTARAFYEVLMHERNQSGDMLGQDAILGYSAGSNVDPIEVLSKVTDKTLFNKYAAVVQKNKEKLDPERAKYYKDLQDAIINEGVGRGIQIDADGNFTYTEERIKEVAERLKELFDTTKVKYLTFPQLEALKEELTSLWEIIDSIDKSKYHGINIESARGNAQSLKYNIDNKLNAIGKGNYDKGREGRRVLDYQNATEAELNKELSIANRALAQSTNTDKIAYWRQVIIDVKKALDALGEKARVANAAGGSTGVGTGTGSSGKKSSEVDEIKGYDFRDMIEKDKDGNILIGKTKERLNKLLSDSEKAAEQVRIHPNKRNIDIAQAWESRVAELKIVRDEILEMEEDINQKWMNMFPENEDGIKNVIELFKQLTGIDLTGLVTSITKQTELRTDHNGNEVNWLNGIVIKSNNSDVGTISFKDGTTTATNKESKKLGTIGTIYRDIKSVQKRYSQMEFIDPAYYDQSKQKLEELKALFLELQGYAEDKSVNLDNIDEVEEKLKYFQEQMTRLDILRGNGSGVIGSIIGADIDERQVQLRRLAQGLVEGTIETERFSNNNKQLDVSVKGSNNTLRTYTLTIDNMGQVTAKLSSETKSVSLFGKAISGLGNKFKELLRYFAMSFSIMRVFSMFRSALTVVKDMDAAMTELRKVSNDTTAQLNAFRSSAYDIASEVGTTGKSIISSVADWERLGEGIDDAIESAKTTSILLNVSEFESIEAATEALVAMSQAYSDLDKMDIVDKLNAVGNNYSISTDQAASALQKSSSSLLTAGNDMNEAIALITAGNATVQDADSVGAGMRTIALRLVGTKAGEEELSNLGEETEGYISSVSKLREKIMDATKAAGNGVGFDILDANGNYKSTYQIMLGLADMYDEIVAKDKELGTNNLNLLLETIAGKNRSNIAASILQNKELLESVYNTAANESSGSALKENQKYMDSIQGHIDQLTNKWQALWDVNISNDFINAIIDAAGVLVDAAREFGLLGTSGALGGVVFGIKTVYNNFDSIKTAFDDMKVAQEAINSLSEFDISGSLFKGTSAYDAVIDAIKSMNKAEAELTLTTLGLDSVQRQEIMTDVGIIASKKGVTSALLEEAVNTTIADANTKKEIFTKLGLIEADGTLTKSEFALNSEKVKSIITSAGLTKETEKEVLAKLSLSGANEKAAISSNVLGAGLKGMLGKVTSATKGVVALAMAHPVLSLSMLAAGAVATYFGATLIKSYKSQKEIAKNAEDAKNEISKLNDQMKKTSDTVENSSKRYALLAQEVDHLGNVSSQNKGTLNEDEYKEFLDLSNKLAEVFPSLTKGYDDNGNAILNLSGNVDTITGSLNNLLDVEQRIANQKIAEAFPDVLAGYNSVVKKSRNELYDQENFVELLGNENLFNGEVISELDNDRIIETYNSIKEILTNNGYKFDDIFEHWFEDDLLKFKLNTDVLDDTQITEIKNLFAKVRYEEESKLLSIQSDISQANNDLAKDIYSLISNGFAYNSIGNDSQKQIVDEILKNGDYVDNIPVEMFEDSAKLTEYLETNIIDGIKGINSSTITSELADVLSGGMSNEDALEVLTNLLPTFSDNNILQNFITGWIEQINNKIEAARPKTASDIANDLGYGIDKIEQSFRIAREKRARQAFDDANEAIQREYKTLWSSGMSASAINAVIDGKYNKVGNVNVAKNEKLDWNEETLEKYKKQLQSWGEYNELLKDVQDGFSVYASNHGIEKAFGADLVKDKKLDSTIPIAFTPMLYDENGKLLTYLSSEEVSTYVNKVLQKALSDGKITEAEILKIDAEGVGYKVGNDYVKGIIAGASVEAGSTSALDSSYLLHYGGPNGALNYELANRANAFNIPNSTLTADVDKYLSDVGDLDKALDAISNGTFTDKDFKDLSDKFNVLKGRSGDLDTAIRELVRDMNTNMVKKFGDQFGLLDSRRDIKMLLEYEEAVLSVGRNVANTNFSIDINTEREGMDNLYDAISASASATGLNSEQVSNLIDRYKDLKDFDPEKLFERTENGIRLNIEALNDLENSYEETFRDSYKDKLKELSDKYNDLTYQIDRTSDASMQASLYVKRQEVLDQIKDVQMLAAQYEGLTSSFNKYLKATSTTDDDYMFSTLSSALENMEKAYEGKKVGTDDFRSYVQMWYDEDLTNFTPDEIAKKYDVAHKSMQRYLTDDISGLKNFVADLDKIGNVDNVLNISKDKNGDYFIDILNDRALAAEFASRGIQMSTEAIQMFMRAMQSYSGWEMVIHSDYADVELSQTKVEELVTTLENATGEEYNFDIASNDQSSLDKQIEKVKEIKQTLSSDQTRLKLDSSELQTAISAADQLIYNLYYRKYEQQSSGILNFDTTQFTSDIQTGLDEAILLVDDFIAYYSTYKANAEMGINSSEVEKKMDETIKKLQEYDGGQFSAELNISDESNYDEVFNLIKTGGESAVDTYGQMKAAATEAYQNAEGGANDVSQAEEKTIEGSNKLIDSLNSMPTDFYETVTGLAGIDNMLKQATDRADALRAALDRVKSLQNQVANYSGSGQISVGNTSGGIFPTALGTYANGSNVNRNGQIISAETALVNEVGTEGLIRDGVLTEIPGGAHTMSLKSGDIILNHEQMDELKATGEVTSNRGHGKLIGGKLASHADGTLNAYPGGSSGHWSSSLAGSVKKSSSKNGSGDGSGSEKEAEVLDWIETLLSRIQREVENLGKIADATWDKWENRTKALGSEMKKVTEELNVQASAAATYLKQAESINLSDAYKKKVQNGELSIEDITDEELKKKIDKYKEW